MLLCVRAWNLRKSVKKSQKNSKDFDSIIPRVKKSLHINSIENKAKRFEQNNLLSDDINSLATVYCYCTWVKWLEKQKNKKKKLQCSLTNCFSLRKPVKTYCSQVNKANGNCFCIGFTFQREQQIIFNWQVWKGTLCNR